MNILDKISNKLLKPLPEVPAGIYHSTATTTDDEPLKYHLRVEPNGNGLLILNAHAILHLNQTATEYAYHLVTGHGIDQVAAEMGKRYRISEIILKQDFNAFTEKLNVLLHTPDLDPEIFLDFERKNPYEERLSAPYRIDCALTYHEGDCNESQNAPQERVTRELETAEWKSILEKAWNVGIPHVIFTGGDPTLRPDLPELVTYAQTLGQVTGVYTSGCKLNSPEYMKQLLDSGLDHLVLCVEPGNDPALEALTRLINEDLHLTVHLTLEHEAIEPYLQLLERLQALGVQTISLSTTSPTLEGQVKELQQRAFDLNMNVVWDIPVPYSRHNPVNMEYEGQTYRDGAGNAWLYIEPDGDVLPAQGINTKLGNMLSDDWRIIWEAAGNAARSEHATG